jgi:histidinol-phosphate aminotransferase
MNPVSRRTFMQGLAAALSYSTIPVSELLPHSQQQSPQPASDSVEKTVEEEYDELAKLANNENPYGPSQAVLKAMEGAFKYANRYGYPDGGIVGEIADFHQVSTENILLGAGSSEILKACDDAFLAQHKLIIGPDPTYESVYVFATNSKADAIKVPLTDDYRTDIPGMIRAVKNNYRDVGFVYICNPNNPTGQIVPKQEIKQLLDSMPSDVPVLIDEAYHHFVDNPDYAESIPYVREGRNVIIARTFSKIAGLAGMRLGYAVAPKELIDKMRPVTNGSTGNGSINVLVKYAGLAALKDKDYETMVRKRNAEFRKKTMAELKAHGYEVIPSEANFFMVDVGEDVDAAGFAFLDKGILVGRKFPSMDGWLRVSVGTEDEMNRFVTAFKEIFPPIK